MTFLEFRMRIIAPVIVMSCLLAGSQMALAQNYTSDTNIADFTSRITSYATFSHYASTTGCGTPTFTPTSSELASTGCRVYTGTLTGTGLAANNWIEATFSNPVSSIMVFPNIDHFGSAYDGFQYSIAGSNDGVNWTMLFDPQTVVGTAEPFTLGTFTGSAPSSVNNVLTPQSPGLPAGCSGTATPCAIGYIAQFNFGTAYKYYAFGASTVAAGNNPSPNPDQELSAVGALPPPTGETVYVSTFSGNQIVKVVDGVPSAATTVINTNAPAEPEDIVVGPDGKIYICDSDQSQIRRMNQDGSLPEIVYNQSAKGATDCSGGSCPLGPEGPSFDTLGNLFFNTRNAPHTGVWKIPAAQLSSIPLGTATPVNVVTASQTGSSWGEGTTFDANDKLLFVDRSGGNVWRFDPAAPTPLTKIITLLNTPFGIAVDSAGDIFVSNSDTHQVLRFDSTGAPKGPYVNFAPTECYPCDSPAYLQFDASDRLFVVTNHSSTGQFGKVWRVDPVGTPPSAGTPTLLVDLSARGSASMGAAVGLGLPTTTFITPPQPIAPGTTNTFTDGTVMTQTLQLPADVSLGGAAFMAVSFTQIAPGVFNSTRLPAINPNTWSGGTSVPPGTTIIPIKGTGGNGIVSEKLCFDANQNPIKPCNIVAPTTLIQLTSRYDTQSPQPNPALIIATDGQNDWANITDAFTTDCCTISGGTKALNTDEAIVNLPPTMDTSSIIRVIGNFLNAGCIDNAGVANALISKLSAAQAAISSGDKQTAINILTAFKKQVQAQSGKHILPSCTLGGITFAPGTVLLSDAQSLIDNLRISITADPITGFVVDSIGNPISGAIVSIIGSAGTVSTATSDITGFFFFPTTGVLASGSNYTVQVTTLPSGFTTSTPTSQPFTWAGSGIALSNFVVK